MIGLPAGLALFAAFLGLPLWLWRRSPPWIQRFEYDGEILTYALDAGRPVESHPVEDIAAVSDYYRRRQGLAGYLHPWVRSLQCARIAEFLPIVRHLQHEIILKPLFYTAVLVSELVGIRIEEVDEQIQLISWHESKKSLEVYQRLSLDTVEDAYQEAVQNIDM